MQDGCINSSLEVVDTGRDGSLTSSLLEGVIRAHSVLAGAERDFHLLYPEAGLVGRVLAREELARLLEVPRRGFRDLMCGCLWLFGTHA